MTLKDETRRNLRQTKEQNSSEKDENLVFENARYNKILFVI